MALESIRGESPQIHLVLFRPDHPNSMEKGAFITILGAFAARSGVNWGKRGYRSFSVRTVVIVNEQAAARLKE